MSTLTERALAITERERARYAAMSPESQAATDRARKVLPLGVASNFQFFEPHPVVVARAQGSHMWDVDGNEYIDFNGGYGSLLAGHSHPVLVEAVRRQAAEGTLLVTPHPTATEVAEELCRRFPMDMVRFTNSGTESTMDALRLARAYTGRDKVIKLEGGYHGHHDLVMMSVKPPLDKAGPADHPAVVPFYGGIPHCILSEIVVIPFNNLEALERGLRRPPGGDRRLHPGARSGEHGHRAAR